MLDKVVWKVILIVGGLIGGIYCCPKLVTALTELYDCINDPYSVFLGPYIEEYQRDALIFGILSVICLVAFIVGANISLKPDSNNNDNNNNSIK